MAVKNDPRLTIMGCSISKHGSVNLKKKTGGVNFTLFRGQWVYISSITPTLNSGITRNKEERVH